MMQSRSLMLSPVWEILIIVLVLLFMAVLVAGTIVLIVWLVNRQKRPRQPVPPYPGAHPPSTSGAVCPRCGSALPPNAPQGLCPRCVMSVGMTSETEATGPHGPHGTKIVPPPEAEIARRFPNLEILECLGQGGMGIVYKARQPQLNRLVALKILAPEKGADPRFAERFLREAQALARLSHPHIVTVHDFGEADGTFYLLMEYVDGLTLRQLLRDGRIKPEEALKIVPPICEALQFAHEKGIVHRDIKPENVLLDKQGRVKIADFGIAKLVSPERGQAALTQERAIIGTPHYMAPEQVERPQLVDHRADIYSLGVVFYEMLTGELPLGRFQPPSRKVQVDVRLDEVVLHALEKEPDRRYQKASEVRTDVEAIRSGLGTIRPAPEAGVSGSDKRYQAEALIAGIGTVLFLLMFPIVVELSRRSAVPMRGVLIFMCVIGLLTCALSLAGIWPFPSPWFPEPNFSSRNVGRVKRWYGSPAAASPRFSRTAIAGAAWAPFFFFAALSYLTVHTVAVAPGTSPPAAAWWQFALALTLLPLGLSAPFGTTILGIIAVSQVRHSLGNLYGLGLAVFDALLFPLLTINGLLIAGWSYAADGLGGAWIPVMGRAPFTVLMLGIIAGSCLAASWFVIRIAWRSANKPLVVTPASAATSP